MSRGVVIWVTMLVDTAFGVWWDLSGSLVALSLTLGTALVLGRMLYVAERRQRRFERIWRGRVGPA